MSTAPISSISTSSDQWAVGPPRANDHGSSDIPIIPSDVYCVQSLSPWRLPSMVGGDQNLQAINRSSRSTRVALRQREFRMGRRIALRALKQAGYRHDLSSEQASCPASTDPTLLIPSNPDRSPKWPPGFVGSISHSQRWIIAAVSQSDRYRSLGIDTDTIVSKQQAIDLKTIIGTASEWQHLDVLNLHLPVAATLLFSAKESYFKCWYPLTGQFWDFYHVRLVGASVKQDRSLRGSRLATGNLTLKSIHPIRLPESCSATPLSVHFQINSPDIFTFCCVT